LRKLRERSQILKNTIQEQQETWMYCGDMLPKTTSFYSLSCVIGVG
jgi:hypothetical protein